MNSEDWDEVVEAWRAKYAAAQANMRARGGNLRTLIEVAAQHPLKSGLYPNEEFSARLNRGLELYTVYAGAGRDVEIYVPGSRHKYKGVADQISLSTAGRSYLIEHGVPDAAVRGEDLNLRYKGSDGVYGSADECFVAASFYKDANFGVLVSVSSPAQMLRKTLHYFEFGVVPLNFTASVQSGFHDYLDELFEQIPKVLTIDSTLQGDSAEAMRLRKERKPE